MKRRVRGEGGGVVVELTLLTPMLLLFLLLVVSAGRFVDARLQVDGAARDAARAASLERSSSGATSAAQAAAEASLETQSVTCRQLSVATDTSQFSAGGSVAVDVSCGVDLSDLSLLRLPGQRMVTSQATAVVDAYRGDE